MKECDIFWKVSHSSLMLWNLQENYFQGSKHTLTLSTYFQRVRTSRPPGSTPLVSHPNCRRSIVGRTACMWAVSKRINDDGSPTPTCWSFVLGHDNLSLVEQQRHWLEDTDCLELIRHKDGSIVSISKINEVIISNCSSNNSFEWKNVTFSGGQSILWPLQHIFRGSGPTPTPQDLGLCLSVFVTLVHCIHTAEDIVNLFGPIAHHSSFLIPALTPKSKRTPSTGAQNTLGEKNLRFSTEIAVYRGNGAR